MYPAGPLIWMAVVSSIALAFIALVLWTLLTLLNVFHQPTHESPDKDLKRRLVSGEIGMDEHAKRSAALSKTKRAA